LQHFVQFVFFNLLDIKSSSDIISKFSTVRKPRGCLVILGTWSHLRYVRGSVLAHLFIWRVIPTWISRLITLRYLGQFILQFATCSVAVWLGQWSINRKILGSILSERDDLKKKIKQCYIFICNNQDLSKYSYSMIYLVKYLYFSCTTKI
jgi:hypothetical protein